MHALVIHKAAFDLRRGEIVSVDGSRSDASPVESIQEKGPKVLLKVIGSDVLIVDKDRRVAVFSNSIQ